MYAKKRCVARKLRKGYAKIMNTKLGILGLLALMTISCSEGFSDVEEFDARLTTPTADVVKNVNPPAGIIVSNVETFATEQRENILDYINGDTTDERRSTLIKHVVNENNETEISVDEWISSFNGTLSECNFGGSRSVTGSADIVLDANRSSGTLIGEFAIVYDNCQEQSTFSASDETCSVVPTINGTLAGTITSSFAISNEFVTDVTSISIDSDPLNITVIQTATEQSYSIEYEFDSNSNDDGFVGEVNFNSSQYDIPTVEQFASTFTAAQACPPPPAPKEE